jgi:UDP-N-acetylglucosamine--N-acetylmuramyl-(pentapeptide) pyrophosphoryl-undecaprenol N-acetylglucosamine transferase
LLTFGLFTSIRIIWNFKPDFIIGTGGYVCGAVFLAGKLLGKKIVIHEQNFIPGRLNRFFAKYSKFIFTSFEGSEEFFGLKENDKRKKIIFSGNPVRHSIREFMNKTRDFNRFGLERDRFTIIAFGGSLGAEKINDSVSGLYKYFRDSKKIQFLLICGHRFYDGVKKVLDGFNKPSDKLIFRLFPYIKDMAELYRVTDLVVSRAGATTIAELYFTGIPAILVPYPEAIANHQLYNANYLVDPGKAIMIPDKDLNEEHLYEMIKKILSNKKEKYISMKNTDIKKLKMESEAVIVEKLFASIQEAKY